MYRSSKTLRKRAKSRAKRHGLTCKSGSRAGKRRRWLVHQLNGGNGYQNTDLP